MEYRDQKINFIKHLKDKLRNEKYKGLKTKIEMNNGFNPLFIIEKYPDSIMKPSSFMSQKNTIHHLKKAINQAIELHFSDLVVIENEHLIPMTNEEKLAIAKREKLAEDARLKKIKDDEIRAFNDDHSSIFSFKSSKSLYPNFIEFKPNSTTLNILKKYIHDDCISELEDYFQFTQEKYFNIKIKNGLINHFESENLNTAFMYSINLLCNKMYVVEPFNIPKPMINLIIQGNSKSGIKPATSDPLIRQKLKKLPLRILEQEKTRFCNFVFRHIEGIVTFNSFFEKDLAFHIRNKLFNDKNQVQVTKALNKYLAENNLELSELFTIDTSTVKGMKLAEDCRKKLILIFTMLVSKYFKLYYENNIDMTEYTKNDKQKNEDESDVKKPKPQKSKIQNN